MAADGILIPVGLALVVAVAVIATLLRRISLNRQLCAAEAGGSRPKLDRATVAGAVEEYGLAWTTQDPERAGRLFSDDAVYVERAFDKNGTFVGRAAIEEYWRYQICGKQSNIRFRHVAEEMVVDAARPEAVVKWLAEFDNRREKRGDKAEKRVRFCQLAKLIFDDGGRIRYLEEYAQSVSGPSSRWPPLDASAEELWAQGAQAERG